MSHRLLLVDGHAYAYRAFHAIRSLNAPDGSPTNAIFGFIKMLQKMLATLTPSHLLIIWDGGLAPERMTALPEYKANRPPTPDSLAQQLPQVESWLTAAGHPQFVQEGTEADDWIGTYTRRAEQQGWNVVIASSDKDFMQLVNERVGLFNPNDKSEKIWGAADVEAKTGVSPNQIVDWLALVGDSVDNIPGVPGVGPKTATDLLKRFGTVEALYSRLSEIKSENQRAALAGATEAVRRNQIMVRLNCALPDGPELTALVSRPADRAQLRAMYERWHFRSLRAELGEDGEPQQGQLWSPGKGQ
ncbi:MAG TPA: 5'-3' exonuclease H3TH domain-containing protein [Verrucomicrobiota bacterium]|nr:5'-3' exonuclease H3TH domain-containing protein [Verrucomicrobiota bacterium]